MLVKKLSTFAFLMLFSIGLFASNDDEFVAFFKEYEALSNEFDGRVINLYSDNAIIKVVRISQDGTEQMMTLSGKKWKEVLTDALQINMKHRNKNTFSGISVEITGVKAKISATRYSSLKCYHDRTYYMAVEKKSDNSIVIVEESMESREYPSCNSGSINDLELLLKRAATVQSRELPLLVDAGTMLIKVSAQGSIMTHYYRLLNFSSNELDPNMFVEYLIPNVVKQTCTMPTMKSLIDKGATISYQYKGSDDIQVLMFDVVKQDCQ